MGRLSTSDEMSGGAYASINVLDRSVNNRPFKKLRVSEPPTTSALISGDEAKAAAQHMMKFAQLHADLMRISGAQNEHEVLGLDLNFALEDMQSRFEEVFAVLCRDNVEKVHPILMAISREALQRVTWASQTIRNRWETVARTLIMKIVRVDDNVRDKIDWD